MIYIRVPVIRFTAPQVCKTINGPSEVKAENVANKWLR